jgi:hypothetical protein
LQRLPAPRIGQKIAMTALLSQKLRKYELAENNLPVTIDISDMVGLHREYEVETYHTQSPSDQFDPTKIVKYNLITGPKPFYPDGHNNSRQGQL